MTTVYVASKARHAPWWAALRACGLPISPACSWIDWPYNEAGAPEPSIAEWRTHWDNCVKAAANADALIFVDLPGEVAKGALIEMGAALGSGKEVYLVSETDWSIRHHPGVRPFRRLSDAVTAIIAGQQP
jgi:hypothetical protein